MSEIPRIGILKLDTSLTYIPGDVGNRSTYSFAVEDVIIPEYYTDDALAGNRLIRPTLLNAAENLIEKGVQAITGNCGFMLYHQNYLQQRLDIPVLLSSLLQLPFIWSITPKNQKVLVVTASKPSLSPQLLEQVGDCKYERLVIVGLEKQEHFRNTVLFEQGEIIPESIEKELITAILPAMSEHNIGAILLECSVLPPYSAEIARRFSLPVFDYNSMICQVYQALVPPTYE